MSFSDSKGRVLRGGRCKAGGIKNRSSNVLMSFSDCKQCKGRVLRGGRCKAGGIKDRSSSVPDRCQCTLALADVVVLFVANLMACTV